MKQNDHLSQQLKIGITHGDYNGISYEIVLNTLCDNLLTEFFTPVFFGSSKIVSYYKSVLHINDFSFTPIKQNEIIMGKSNIYNVTFEDVNVKMGISSEDAAQLGESSLIRAQNFAHNKMIDAIVCCPINVTMLKEFSSQHIKNGSYYAKKYQSNNVMQVFCGDNMKITFLTTNTEGNNILDEKTIFEKISNFNKILKEDFMIEMPKIAVIANNVSDEQAAQIDKATQRAIQESMFCFGPYLEAKFFSDNYNNNFDALITISESQAESIFSPQYSEEGVIYTAGLPFVVTEPYHDSKYEIVGKNIANTQALRNALFLANDLTQNRYMNYSLRKNALNVKNLSDKLL